MIIYIYLREGKERIKSLCAVELLPDPLLELRLHVALLAASVVEINHPASNGGNNGSQDTASDSEEGASLRSLANDDGSNRHGGIGNGREAMMVQERHDKHGNETIHDKGPGTVPPAPVDMHIDILGVFLRVFVPVAVKSVLVEHLEEGNEAKGHENHVDQDNTGGAIVGQPIDTENGLVESPDVGNLVDKEASNKHAKCHKRSMTQKTDNASDPRVPSQLIVVELGVCRKEPSKHREHECCRIADWQQFREGKCKENRHKDANSTEDYARNEIVEWIIVFSGSDGAKILGYTQIQKSSSHHDNGASPFKKAGENPLLCNLVIV